MSHSCTLDEGKLDEGSSTDSVVCLWHVLLILIAVAVLFPRGLRWLIRLVFCPDLSKVAEIGPRIAVLG